jgi:hypothetical protein
VISNAKKTYLREDLDLEALIDPRIITLEEMITNNSFLPPINNNSFGKATGTLVKSLLNNLGSNGGKKSDDNRERFGKKIGNQPGS